MSESEYVAFARCALGLPARTLPPVLRRRRYANGRVEKVRVPAAYPAPSHDEAAHARLCAQSALAWADDLDDEGMLGRAADLRATAKMWTRYARTLELLGGAS